MTEMEETPDWFQLEKIHRFDGPENGVSLYTGSQPFVEIKVRSQPTPLKETTKPSETEARRTSSVRNDTQTKSKSGCGLLVVLLTLVGLGSQYVF